MKNKFDLNMDILRKDLLKNIYEGNHVTDAELNLTDLAIYSNNNSLFSKLSRALNISELDENICLTNEQVECLNILEDKNLFLSAPTSFGKTYIALEYISRNTSRLNNIIFVVPTISLMNELRKKCYTFFNKEYILITSDAELEQYYYESKKIMIVVPERISTKQFKQYINNNTIDLLVYDEIYKLKKEENTNSNNERIIKMNYIYKYLIHKSKKILLLGPFIKSVNFDKSDIKIEKYITNLNLVYNDVQFDSEPEIANLDISEDKKFIYFKSPGNIKKFLENNSTRNNGVQDYAFDKDIIQWISDNIHPDWYYSIYLKKGIGIHHGKTPIFLRKYIEHEYSKEGGLIHTILCTSTLMEGINTPTNKLIIHDAPQNTFELNNLIGRVGRLNTNHPKSGKVYILDEKVKKMYDPNKWIDLNILYEVDDIMTNTPEDEMLYLDKKSIDGEIEEKIKLLENELLEKFDINLEEIIEAGIEIELFIKFLEIYHDIINYEKEWQVINDIKYKILRDKNKYINGIKVSSYSFDLDREYIFDVVYSLIINQGNMKPIIEKFISMYKPNINDINIFIDTLFEIDEFIKFKMMKMVGIYDLFCSKNLFDKSKNRAFIQSMLMIKAYSDSSDGYERILGDMGIPHEDIVDISNEISKYKDIKGTEYKLKLLKSKDIFNELSPFSKHIIEEL